MEEEVYVKDGVATVVTVVTIVEVDPTVILAEEVTAETMVDLDITMEDLVITMEDLVIIMEDLDTTLEVDPTATLAEEATVEEIVDTIQVKALLAEEEAVVTQVEAMVTVDTIVEVVEALNTLYLRFLLPERRIRVAVMQSTFNCIFCLNSTQYC